MLARALRPMSHFSLAAILTAMVALSGCQSLLNSRYSDSVHPDQGIVRVKGLAQSVVIRRNALGMPLIEPPPSTTRYSPWAMCMPATASARWSACA